jgi:hypothetical protein
LYSPTDFVESSRAIRSGKKKTDFGQSMRLFGNLLTFIIETKKYEEKKIVIGLVACALIAH